MRLGNVPEDEARSVLVDVLRKVATNYSSPIPHSLLLQEAMRSRQVLAGQATAPCVEQAEAPPSMKVAQSYLALQHTTPPQSPDLDPSIALRLGAPQVACPFAAQYFSPPLPTSPPLAPLPPPLTATWTQRPNSAIPSVRTARAIPVATAVPAAGDLRSTACVPLFCREDESHAAVHQGALRRAHASATSTHRSAPDAPAVVGWTPAGWSKPAAELGGWPKGPQPTGVPPKLEMVGTRKAPVTPAVERQDVLADGVMEVTVQPGRGASGIVDIKSNCPDGLLLLSTTANFVPRADTRVGSGCALKRSNAAWPNLIQ
jgi:hypothetical protein